MIMIVGLSTMVACISSGFKMGNPVKFMFNLTITSLLFFTIMFLNSGSSWAPALMFLLLTGGILIMFMILSSLMPNQSSNKSKMLNPLAMLVTAVMLAGMSFPVKSSQGGDMMSIKNSAYSSSMSILAASVISVYFFGFINVLESKKNSLRQSLCCDKSIL